MADFEDKIQALMDEAYGERQKEENKGKGKWDVLGGLSAAHQIAVVFGNFNYQVENGGIHQWISNGYFHDDAEKFTEYLEIGAKSDERCRSILDRVYTLDQYAQETDCDREGYYYDEDGENFFIGDMIDSNAFDTWYYEKCDGDNWWQVVSGIIDKVEGREPAPVRQDEHDGETAAAAHSPIQVYIENVHDDSIGGFTIPLPVKLNELQGFLEASEISGWQDAEILQVRSDIANLGKLLTETVKKTMSPVMLDELNYLAVRVNGLEEYGLEIFTAAVEANRHNGSISELINLTFTENLNCFNLMPAFSNEQYGDFLIEQDGVDAHANAFNRLENSDEPEDVALAKYIEKLEKYVDRDAYGRDAITEEESTLTRNGLLLGGDGIQELYRGQQDIPDEHRIFTKPGEIYKPLMKLDDVDVAETLVKIHAVCCGTMNGVADALKTVLHGQDNDYLLMVNKDRTFLTPAVEAYKSGEIAERTINHWSRMPGTSYFALRVMDSGEENGYGMTGDFVELNMDALLSNMKRHAVIPDRIEVFRHDGFSKSYDFMAWQEVSRTPQHEIKNVVEHFPEDDLDYAADRYASFMSANEVSSEAVSANTFLSTINAAYMADAKNPQPDMLRITNEAAKQILARGDMEVFKLSAVGVERLAPIEAARPMCFAEHRELAIKCEDISGLDKWAKSAVKSIQRQNGRDERKQVKNKGEEL